MLYVIESFLEESDYDVRISGNARWCDQKCTPDVVSFIADCVINFSKTDYNIRFSSRDIWDFEYASKTIREIFRKPNTQSPLSQNEYDKFFSQPLELLSYSKVLTKYKVGNRNFYTVNQRAILDYIAVRERNALDFLYLYFKKVLMDSDLWGDFNIFFQNQNQNTYFDLKTKFENFTIKYTKINNKTEVRRIFSKILNPIAFKHNKRGTYRGRISKHEITLAELMYNRNNFRDIWSEKPKNVTRKEWLKEIERDINPDYYRYQSLKAKKFLKEYNNKYRNSKSELDDEFSVGNATQIHHIFPESEFPTISGFLENLVALTPTQHLFKAHPNNNTSIIDKDYQELLLKTKALIIKENLMTDNIIYSFENFSMVLNTGFEYEEYINITNFESAMIVIQNYYN
ncbi:restriction endonuclease [Erysipelothrix rhusiopathiae]|nr:restriction endonuclease [Erysipelothrix rhusiopathiae]